MTTLEREVAAGLMADFDAAVQAGLLDDEQPAAAPAEDTTTETEAA